MKKVFLAILAYLALPVFVHAQQTVTSGFTIKGNIKGLTDKSRVFLTNGNNPNDTVANTYVKDGAFILRGVIAEPNLYEINFGSAKKKAALFIGNDNMAILGTIENLKSLQVTGSPTNSDFMDFQATFNPYFAKLNTLVQLSNSPEGAAKSDSISRAYASVVASVQVEIDKFIQLKRDSYVSPFFLVVVSQLTDDVFLSEKRLNTLTARVQNGFYGKILKEQIENGKIGAIGTNAIDFTQNDTTGNPVTLSSFKGKYVLVDFWASWCHPCRLENPNVVNIYSKFKNKNFTILSVSLDKAREPWIKAIHDDNLTWAHVSDLKFWNNEVALKYKVQSIPQNFLIDPNGKIVAKNLRGPDLEAKLCELVGCN